MGKLLHPRKGLLFLPGHFIFTKQSGQHDPAT
jgi:hypothetical protein